MELQKLFDVVIQDAAKLITHKTIGGKSQGHVLTSMSNLDQGKASTAFAVLLCEATNAHGKDENQRGVASFE